MTINFFLQSNDFGGAEQFAIDLIATMAVKKQRVVLYTNNLHLLKKLENKKLIDLYKIPIYLDFAGNYRGLIKSILLLPFATLNYLKILHKISQRTDKQIILYSGFSEKIMPGAIAKLFKLPIYFIEYGPLNPLFKKLLGIPKILYFLNKNHAQKIIVPSQNTKRALQNIFNQKKIVLIPCGTKAIKTKKQINTKKRIVTVVSRLEEGKGQDLLIKAFALVKKEIANVQLQIIGQGNFYQQLKKLAKNDKQIAFLQHVENKQELLEKSEIIVCPSVWPLEGFGLTIIEAMAFEKPIVAFNRAPGNEILIDEHNALLAQDQNYLDLAQKIIQLLKDKKLQTTLAFNAKRTFIKKYEISNVTQKYLNLFKN
jgi:glycosyltransferase involved in cell wall biosynthesis